MQNKIKIAVCDDSFFDREINKLYIEDYMLQKGFETEIQTFSSGTELLNTDLTQFSLIFLDIYMDGINGIETAKTINKINPGIKIVFCSSSPEFAAESFEVEAYHYFIKPMRRDRFQNLMDELFGESEEQP